MYLYLLLQNSNERQGAALGSPKHAAGQLEPETVMPQRAHAAGDGVSPSSKKTAPEDLFRGSLREVDSSTQPIGGIEAVIDSYHKETSNSFSACPPKWWKRNAEFYPLLSTLAKLYLSVPAASVQSEIFCSTAGNTINAQRPQLFL